MKPAKLHVVKDDEPYDPDEELAVRVPELLAAERAAEKARRCVLEAGRALARKRRVAFIREEHLRQEFGG